MLQTDVLIMHQIIFIYQLQTSIFQAWLIGNNVCYKFCENYTDIKTNNYPQNWEKNTIVQYFRHTRKHADWSSVILKISTTFFINDV